MNMKPNGKKSDKFRKKITTTNLSITKKLGWNTKAKQQTRTKTHGGRLQK